MGEGAGFWELVMGRNETDLLSASGLQLPMEMHTATQGRRAGMLASSLPSDSGHLSGLRGPEPLQTPASFLQVVLAARTRGPSVPPRQCYGPPAQTKPCVHCGLHVSTHSRVSRW